MLSALNAIKLIEPRSTQHGRAESTCMLQMCAVISTFTKQLTRVVRNCLCVVYDCSNAHIGTCRRIVLRVSVTLRETTTTNRSQPTPTKKSHRCRFGTNAPIKQYVVLLGYCVLCGVTYMHVCCVVYRGSKRLHSQSIGVEIDRRCLLRCVVYSSFLRIFDVYYTTHVSCSMLATDRKFMQTFTTTYQSFTVPTLLLQKLMERYQVNTSSL